MDQQGEQEAAVAASLSRESDPRGNRCSRKVLDDGRVTAGER